MAEVAKVLRNFQITVPKKLREKFRLKEGEMVRMEERPEGILVCPLEMVDRSQTWFWSKEWQKGEKEVDAEIRRGKLKRFATVDSFLKDLKK